jgi:hypothetical protein
MHRDLTTAITAPRSTTARVPIVERRLARFCPRLQPRIREFAARHSRIADLAASFPGLLFALAMPRAGFDPAPVVASVIAGDPLARLAERTGLPVWLRKLPPGAFERTIGRLPDGEGVRLQIANLLPRAKHAAMWLEAVSTAYECGNDDIALWIAGELTREPHPVPVDRLRCICLWAWFTSAPGTHGYALVGKPWHSTMSIETAKDLATRWAEKADLYANLGDGVAGGVVSMSGAVGGYEFVPLQTAASIMDEAAALENCLNTYGACLAHQRSQLWSVRQGGQRCAAMEFVNRTYSTGLIINQLRASRNREVPEEVWAAARLWLQKCSTWTPALASLDWGKVPLDRKAWLILWRPYWLAKRRIPHWLPLQPSRAILERLRGVS